MDTAREMAASGASHGSAVQAGVQSAGRGRFGNAWVSARGNLHVTYIVRPKLAVAQWGLYSYAAALALLTALVDMGVPDKFVALKWPNDVWVNGLKMAGILLEAGPDYLLVGIGVNIVDAPEGRTKLLDFNAAATCHDLCQRLHVALLAEMDELESKGFADTRARWLAAAYGLGQTITARLPHTRHIGTFETIDESGVMILRGDDGATHKITSADIQFGSML